MQENKHESKRDLLMLLPIEETLARRQVASALDELAQARKRLERAKRLRREIEGGAE